MSETKEVAGLVERLDKLGDWLDFDFGSDDKDMGNIAREAAREIERLTAERDAERQMSRGDWANQRAVDLYTIENADLKATVSTLTRQLEEAREALEYAGTGLTHIHDSLASSNAPKQASGEMAAHFRDKAAAAIRSLKQGGVV